MKRVDSLCQAGEVGKAYNLVTSPATARINPDEQLFEDIKEKFPPPNTVAPLSEDIKEKMRTFVLPPDVAPKASGARG